MSSFTSKPLQRGSNDSLAGQQDMHGLVDSSDPGMELAETEEVAVSEKQVCVWFWSDKQRLFLERATGLSDV